MQAHGNASQYMPILLLFLALLEADGRSLVWLLHMYGRASRLFTIIPHITVHAQQTEQNLAYTTIINVLCSSLRPLYLLTVSMQVQVSSLLSGALHMLTPSGQKLH